MTHFMHYKILFLCVLVGSYGLDRGRHFCDYGSSTWAWSGILWWWRGSATCLRESVSSGTGLPYTSRFTEAERGHHRHIQEEVVDCTRIISERELRQSEIDTKWRKEKVGITAKFRLKLRRIAVLRSLSDADETADREMNILCDVICNLWCDPGWWVG